MTANSSETFLKIIEKDRKIKVGVRSRPETIDSDAVPESCGAVSNSAYICPNCSRELTEMTESELTCYCSYCGYTVNNYISNSAVYSVKGSDPDKDMRTMCPVKGRGIMHMNIILTDQDGNTSRSYATIPYREKIEQKLFTQIKDMCDMYSINTIIANDTVELYHILTESRTYRTGKKKKKDMILSGSFFASSRKNGLDFTMSGVSDIFTKCMKMKINARNVETGYRTISKILFTENRDIYKIYAIDSEPDMRNLLKRYVSVLFTHEDETRESICGSTSAPSIEELRMIESDVLNVCYETYDKIKILAEYQDHSQITLCGVLLLIGTNEVLNRRSMYISKEQIAKLCSMSKEITLTKTYIKFAKLLGITPIKKIEKEKMFTLYVTTTGAGEGASGDKIEKELC